MRRKNRRAKERNHRGLSVERLELRQLFAGDVAPPVIDQLIRLPSPSREYDFRLTGSSTPLDRVSVSQTGIGPLGEVVADGFGNWTIDVVDTELAAARFEFVATAINVGGDQSLPSEAVSFQPNIVLINTDDMRFDQIQYMPFLTSLTNTATNFQNAFAPTAVSGPSRASLLSGLLSTNNGVIGNSITTGSGLNFDDSSTLATWLSDAGYRTALIGKDRTLPGLEAQFQTQDVYSPPPGWDTYFSIIGGANIGYNGVFTDNGEIFEAGTQYATDVMRDRLLDFVDSPGSEDPFFAYLATNAPHGPGTPAARHDHVFDDFVIPRAPSYLVGGQPPAANSIAVLEGWYREGTESLLAVDEAIEALHQRLDGTGQLDNSIIIFTSDNGQSIGEHSFYGKNRFWEESIRIPLIIWDGREQLGQVSESLATMVDITGTIVDLADAQQPAKFDGVSLTPTLDDPGVAVRDDLLIEHFNSAPGASNPNVQVMQSEQAVRNSDWVYVEYAPAYLGEDRFLFDLANDPYQLNNLADDPAYQTIQADLQARLHELRPADRTTPEISDVAWGPSGGSYDQPQDLSLTFVVDDTNTGGSEVRTPSLSYSPFTLFSQGQPAEPADGVFDRTTESVVYSVSMRQLSQIANPNNIYIAARDIVGNFGARMQVSVPLDASPSLLADDGSGDLAASNLTVAGTRTFAGQALPGERIALFSSLAAQEFNLAGTAVADSLGKWAVAVDFPMTGEHVIYGQKVSPAGADPQEFSFLAPTTVHVIAAVNGSNIDVVGTNLHDHIVVDETTEGLWRISLNGVVGGTLAPANQVIINGQLGNDTLEVRGNIPSRLIGTSGNDTLIGGSAADVLIGGAGINDLSGGPGNDTYLFSFSDRGLLAEISAQVKADYVHERAGEGIDRIAFVGNFEITADLADDSAQPQITLSSNYITYQRDIFVDDPQAIERFDGSEGDSQWTTAQDALILAGSGNDQIVRSAAVAPGDEIELRSLTVGDNEVFAGTVRFTVSTDGGALFFDRALPPEVTLISSSADAIELEGPIDLISHVMISQTIRLQTTAADAGQIRIETETYPLAEPTAVQRDALVASVAEPIELTGISLSTFTEGGPRVLIAQNAQLLPGSGNWAGGSLTVSLLGSGIEHDQVFVVRQAPGPNSITVGYDVFYGGVAFGTIVASGRDGDALKITFNSQATTAAVHALIRRLGYRHLAGIGEHDQRQLRLTLTSADNAVAAVDLSVSVLDSNVAPTITFTAGPTVKYVTNSGSFAGPGTSALVSDPEQNYDGAALVVDFAGFHESTDELRIRVRGLGPNQIWIDGNDVYVSGVNVGSLTETTAQGGFAIQWNANATSHAIHTLIRNLHYRSLSPEPTGSMRQVSFELTDDTGASSGAVLRTIEFNAAPTLMFTAGSTVPYDTDGGTFAGPGTSAFVSDQEQNFAGGTLVVGFVGFRDSADELRIRQRGLGPNQIWIDNNHVYVSGVQVGSLTQTTAQGFSIQWNSGATAHAIHTLIRNVHYRSLATEPTGLMRQVSFALTDGDGASTGSVRRTIEFI